MAERESYAVIGLGLFGSAIARTLASMGHFVLAVDRRLGAVEALGSVATEAVQADATDRAALELLQLHRYSVVFNTIGDLSASILCTLALRELGVKRIFAKINSPQQRRILTRLGAEVTLFPEQDMGERVALQVAASSSTVTTQLDLASHSSIIEILAPPVLVNRTLAEADLRRRFGVTVIAIKRRRAAGELPTEVVVSPPADMVIGPHDLIMVAGSNNALMELQHVERRR